MNRWQRFILKILGSNKKIFCASLIIGLMLSISFCILGKDYSDKLQLGLAQKVMRLHVLANSDSNSDQVLKLKVRDDILKFLSADLKNSKSKIQTKKILSDKLDAIKNIARETIIHNGYDYDVKVLICTDYFPTKQYADVTLPAGNYETLKIIIGQGKGHNWWCVMFPPLCFVDVTKKTVPSNLKHELKNLLSDDEFKIVNYQNEKSLPVKIKFKIVEAWQKYESKNKIAHAAKNVSY